MLRMDRADQASRPAGARGKRIHGLIGQSGRIAPVTPSNAPGDKLRDQQPCRIDRPGHGDLALGRSRLKPALP